MDALGRPGRMCTAGDRHVQQPGKAEGAVGEYVVGHRCPAEAAVRSHTEPGRDGEGLCRPRERVVNTPRMFEKVLPFARR